MESESDHRRIAQRLDLLHFQEEAPGMVFWHPRGLALYRVLEEAARAHCEAQSYVEVKTPQILRRPVWEASGHWQHFGAGMFRVDDDSCEAAVKPVSCPGHIYIAQQRPPSYRELPLRYSELGIVHRDEPSGTLHGLLRLRQFTQDDGHVFCAMEQAEAEVERFCRALPAFYAAFGFDDVSLALSTRPADRAGDDALWDRSEAVLERVLEKLDVPYALQPGQGAFYGPKLEFVLEDRAGRKWQCGTIQFDLVMPERFDVKYVDASGQKVRAVMLHRALYGSLERFMGMLLEQHGAHLPAWLAPEQVVVLPVAEMHASWAHHVVRALRNAGLRARVDARAETLARRVSDAHASAAAFIAVVGGREVESRSIALRSREEPQEQMPLEAALVALAHRCAVPREIGAELPVHFDLSA
jgi:threonyl-tRNA synthetase